mgnify:CR=1 FL=1
MTDKFSLEKENKIISPSIQPEQGILLLQGQQEKGRKLIELRPLGKADYEVWENTTREFIIKAFGSESQNIQHFTLISKVKVIVMTEETWWENHRVKSLENQIIMIGSLIEQLEVDVKLSPISRQINFLSQIEKLCCRFHLVVRQLRSRYDNRPALEVKDEYDVQYLFHALLKIFFDDVRPEEWTPSCAGRASRMDFLLKDHLTAIEVKKTRPNLGAKEIGTQLIDDIERYQSHPSCTTLVCFIYDPDSLISNPCGLERDLSGQKGNILVKVFVVPRS